MDEARKIESSIFMSSRPSACMRRSQVQRTKSTQVLMGEEQQARSSECEACTFCCCHCLLKADAVPRSISQQQYFDTMFKLSVKQATHVLHCFDLQSDFCGCLSKLEGGRAFLWVLRCLKTNVPASRLCLRQRVPFACSEGLRHKEPAISSARFPRGDDERHKCP